MTPSRRALALLACAGVLAVCSSTPSTPNHVTTTTRSTAPASSSTSTSTTASSTTTTTATASSACSHITASAGQGQGAAGTITGVITVTNTGSSTCTTNGYPKIALFSGSSAPLNVTMVNGLSVTLSPPANGAPSPVALAPSSTAQFAYQYSDVPTGQRDELSHLGDGRRDVAGGDHVLGALPVVHRPLRQRDHPGLARVPDFLTGGSATG